MKSRSRKRTSAAPAPRARTVNSRQRQLLIEACISALYIYGPSGTTVERVVAIAKMSPGIVRFYFDSKAAMLVASLKHLAAEFDEQVLAPVTKLKTTPVAALELLVDLYVDPNIASARKVTVWYAYWGEANSREEYYDICGQKDEGFAQLVRELIGRLIETIGAVHLDPDGIALGLIGALEIIWQDIAFQPEQAADRLDAKRRCMAYLRSVFPMQFAGIRLPGEARFGAWVYASAAVFAAERDSVFRESWACAGHASQAPGEGDFFTVDTAAERVLVVRDAAGRLRAFRNNCPQRPHRLVGARHGTAARLRCPTHGLMFELDGTPCPPGNGVPLTELALRSAGGLLLVRATGETLSERAGILDVLGAVPLGRMRVIAREEIAVDADWKCVVEQWLEEAGGSDALTWSRRRYASLQGSDAAAERRFLAPNTWLQVRPDGVCLTEAVPTGAGRCVVRRIALSAETDEARARALSYLASRASAVGRRGVLNAAHSLQAGGIRFGYPGLGSGAAAAAFRRGLLERIPLLAGARAPAVD